MKTYIFIIRRICDITGAEQYTYNKMKFLERLGWRVLIFSSMRGTIIIDEFRKYEKLIYPALYFCPKYFRKKEVRHTINRILQVIDANQKDNCIIESDSLPRAIWGEMIASRLNCRHLFISVQEQHDYYPDVRLFLRFKYDRHELCGISSGVIRQMLGDDSIEERVDSRAFLYCDNVIQNCADTYSEMINNHFDYILGSFGRIDKPCVPAIIDGFYNFARQNPKRQILIIMIGGYKRKGEEKRVRNKFTDIDNVVLLFTGNIYPVPISFVKKFNVFVSTAGAANATFLVGIPTIKVEPNKGKPIGIIGLDYDYPEKSLYKPLTNLSIEECITRAINDKDSIVFNRTIGEDYNKRMFDEFERQLSFVNGVKNKEYYNETLLLKFKKKSRHSHFFKLFFFHLFGQDGIKNFSMIKKRLFKPIASIVNNT